jgi:hypothetical protein
MDIIQADDKLTIRANKTSTDGSGKTHLKFKEGHLKNSVKTEIYKYWNKKDKQEAEYIKPSDYEEEIHGDWLACWVKDYKTNSENIRIYSRDNSLYIAILRLSTSSKENILGSRYRTLLDGLNKATEDIIEYKPRSIENKRNKLEASRQKLNRKFDLYEYEYNIYITDQEKGKAIYKALECHATHIFENTIYLKGYEAKSSRKPGTSVKMYNAGVKHDKEFPSGESFYKIEITIRTSEFKKNKINIKDMTTMEHCIYMVKQIIIKEVMKLNDKTGGEELTNVINFVLKEIVQEENILSRIIKLEASRKDTEKRLKILESAILTERKTIKK